MKKGFTLVEILISIGIVALLSSAMIAYNRVGGRQIILFKEQAKVLGVLSRAKTLSISTFGEIAVSCGWGVHFEAPKTFLIFKDLAASGDCSLADKKYSGTDELFESFDLDSGVEFDSSLTTLSDIVFVPPYFSVVINSDSVQDFAAVVIKTIDGGSSATIKVNSAGQISIISV